MKKLQSLSHTYKGPDMVAWGNFALGSTQTPGKNEHSDTRRFHEHKLAVEGTTLCTMAKIYTHAVFKFKRPNGQIRVTSDGGFHRSSRLVNFFIFSL